MDSEMGNMLVNEVGPRLASMLPNSVSPVGSEDFEELLQDGIAVAAKLLVRCAETGKKVTAGNLAYYSMLLLKTGRRSTGSVATDAMSPMTRIKGRSVVVSVDEPMSGTSGDQSPLTLADILADDREDPAGQALRTLAWEELQEKLSPLEQATALALAEGSGLRDAGRKIGVCASTMSNARKKLAHRISEEWGPGAVAESARQPAWRGNLHAQKERKTARHARSG